MLGQKWHQNRGDDRVNPTREQAVNGIRHGNGSPPIRVGPGSFSFVEREGGGHGDTGRHCPLGVHEAYVGVDEAEDGVREMGQEVGRNAVGAGGFPANGAREVSELLQGWRGWVWLRRGGGDFVEDGMVKRAGGLQNALNGSAWTWEN